MPAAAVIANQLRIRSRVQGNAGSGGSSVQRSKPEAAAAPLSTSGSPSECVGPDPKDYVATSPLPDGTVLSSDQRDALLNGSLAMDPAG